MCAVLAGVRRTRWKNRSGQIATAFLLLEISALFIRMTMDLEVSDLMDSSPATVPFIWAGALAFFSIYQLIRIFREETAPDPETGRLDKVFLTIALVIATIAAIEYVGFYIATSGMLVLMLFLLGVRSLKACILMPLGWSLFAWAIFDKLLHLGLPVGKLWI